MGETGMSASEGQVAMHRYADLSANGRYRYLLGRRWGAGPVVRFVMLNPSTADADTDDPTIRRCIGFAQAWGHAGIEVLNLYAFRAVRPALLWRADDPIGPRNDAYLCRAARQPGEDLLIAAWGADARANRVTGVLELLVGQDVHCLGRTGAGQPRHPLYLSQQTRPRILRAGSPRDTARLWAGTPDARPPTGQRSTPP